MTLFNKSLILNMFGNQNLRTFIKADTLPDSKADAYKMQTCFSAQCVSVCKNSYGYSLVIVIYLRNLFVLVPYGFTEVKQCKLVLSVCGHIHVGSKKYFCPIEMLYNILLV